jgi:hypothetical protein
VKEYNYDFDANVPTTSKVEVREALDPWKMEVFPQIDVHCGPICVACVASLSGGYPRDVGWSYHSFQNCMTVCRLKYR